MKNQRQNSLNLVDICVAGFWFCKSEQRITEVVEDTYGMNRCKFCGSPNLRWNPPVFDAPKSTEFAEVYRVQLDTACNRCQEALRIAVEVPTAENLDKLARAIALAHGALTDLAECEEKLRRGQASTEAA